MISDALNHASIIDGIRLCKARRLRYANNDLNELEQALKDSQSRARAPDRDRRRIFHGRIDRETEARFAIWPIATARW